MTKDTTEPGQNGGQVDLSQARVVHVPYTMEPLVNYETEYFCPSCGANITQNSYGVDCRCGWVRADIAESRKRTAEKKRANQMGKALWLQHEHCWYCGAHAESVASRTVDHVIPWSAGGTNDPTNVVQCCGRCNSAKATMDLEAFREHVRRRLYDVVTPELFWWLQSLGINLPPYDQSPRIVFWGESDRGGWTW